MNSKSQKTNVLILVILFALISQFILLSWSKPTLAESTPEISWTNTKPIVSSSIPTRAPSTSCNYLSQVKQIEGDSDPRTVCIIPGENFRFGTYSSRSFVSFGLDTKMYPLYNICGGPDNCLYIPQSDTMIARNSTYYDAGSSTTIYRNFSTHVTPVATTRRVPSGSEDPTSLKTTEYYEFDTATVPDVILRNADGYAWPIGGFGTSANGNWVAIEFNRRGVGLINLQTMEMKWVLDVSLSSNYLDYYLTHTPPNAELAVSNDGKHVAIAGLGTKPAIIDVTPECAETITDASMSSTNYHMAHPCKRADFDAGTLIYNFWYVSNLKFDDAGGELSFYAVSSSNISDPITNTVTNANQILMRAAGYAKQRIDYLALGDSFSSGEGERESKYYQDGTNDEHEKCHVSTRAYPFLIATDLSFMRSVACSGAKTTDIIGTDDVSYSGQGNRLQKASMTDAAMVLAKTTAENLFIPGRIHQQKFVAEYKPKVITVGVGGNDAGFMDKLKDCASGPGTCEWAGTPHGKHQTAVEVNNLFNTLVATYITLHAASPSTKIYVIGYPQVVNDTGSCWLAKVLLNPTETKFMSEGIIYLNQVVKAAAKAAGVKYIDIEDSYGDQKLCGSKSPAAANQIVIGDDFNPANDALMGVLGNENFHPNSEGHALAAKKIRKELNGGNENGSITIVNDPNYCFNNLTICPDSTSKAPSTPDYWIPPAGYDSNGDPIPVNTDFISRLGSIMRFILNSFALSPGSFVNAEIHSDPVSLGQFRAASDGSFNADIVLPDNLEEGYHTIHLYGTSYSGEPVDIYQIFYYTKSTTGSDTQPKVTITNNTATVTTTTDGANITNATTNTTKPKSTSMTVSNEIDNSSVTDQSSSSIAPVTSQTGKDDVPTDKVNESVSIKAKSTIKPNNTFVYVIIGIFGAVVVIAIFLIRLFRRMRRIKK